MIQALMCCYCLRPALGLLSKYNLDLNLLIVSFAPEHANYSCLFHYQLIWPNSFQTFEDKSNAINENTGVNERLVEMIMKWHQPGQIMAVGKPEYKKIIVERLVSISSWFPYYNDQL